MSIFATEIRERLVTVRRQLGEAIRQLEATKPVDPAARERALARARQALQRVDDQLRTLTEE